MNLLMLSRSRDMLHASGARPLRPSRCLVYPECTRGERVSLYQNPAAVSDGCSCSQQHIISRRLFFTAHMCSTRYSCG